MLSKFLKYSIQKIINDFFHYIPFNHGNCNFIIHLCRFSVSVNDTENEIFKIYKIINPFEISVKFQNEDFVNQSL